MSELDVSLGAACPRCDATVPQRLDGERRGRRRVWCSENCRRRAYEERRAARSGAIGIEVRTPDRAPEVVEIEVEVPVYRTQTVEKVVQREPTYDEAVAMVTASPKACARVLQEVAERAWRGELDDPRNASVRDAAVRLVQAFGGGYGHR